MPLRVQEISLSYEYVLEPEVFNPEALTLQVPNLYMSETHIHTNDGPLPPVDSGEHYMVLQWLDLTAWCDILTHHNTPARRPTTEREKVEWPAAVIMNFMYACAAIRKWGTPALRTTLNKQRESASWAVDKTNQDNRARTARAKKRGR